MTLRHNMPLAFATASDADYVPLNRELQSLLLLVLKYQRVLILCQENG